MNSGDEKLHDQLESKVAEQYRSEGFEVTVEPNKQELPFDLGNYTPDLVVRKGKNSGIIIEVKSSASRINVDRFKEIGKMVSEHKGWKFLLVTGEDISALNEELNADKLLTWSEIKKRYSEIESSIPSNELVGKFLLLWVLLETILRKKAKKISTPIERFPVKLLAKTLYSEGELSFEELESIEQLEQVRNKVVHGFKVKDLEKSVHSLQKIIKSFIAEEFKKEISE